MIFCFILSFLSLTYLSFSGGFGDPHLLSQARQNQFFSCCFGGAPLRVTAGIPDSASLLAMHLDGAATVLPRPIGMHCYIPPPCTQGQELWRSRLRLSVCMRPEPCRSWPAAGLDAQQARSSSALQNPGWSCLFGLLGLCVSVSALCPAQRRIHPRTTCLVPS